MREYWILTKLQLSSLYGVNKIRHARSDESKKQAKRSLFALVAMIFGLGWASTFYSLALKQALEPMGQLPALLGLMAAASGALVLVFSVFETKGVLFGFGDFDTVMSWPVRTSSVVAARVTVMYTYNLVYALLLMLPAGIIYAIAAHPPLWFYPVFALGMLAVPALPTVLGGVLGTLVTVLTSRMKRKGLAGAAMQMLLAGGIMLLSISMSSGMEDLADKAASLGQSVGRLWPPAAWLMRATQGDALYLVLSLAASVFTLWLFARILSMRFIALNARLTAVPHAKTKLTGMRRSAGAVRALYAVEWKRYTGSSLYLANTAFGYVMLIAASMVLGLVRPPILNEVFADPNYPAMRSAIPLLLSLMVCMSGTTFASISIEGKRLWIVKSMPVRARDWFLAKALVSLTLAVPAIVVAGVMIGTGMRFSAYEWVFVIVTPICYAMLTAAFGLFVNLRLPKFDWTTEAEVVKQSAASLICIFTGMFAAGIPIALLLATNAQWALPAATLGALIATALLLRSLTRSGDRRLYRL